MPESIEQIISDNVNSEIKQKLVNEILDFVDGELSKSIKALIEIEYADLRIESPAPSLQYRNNSINFGQWVGVFSFDSSCTGSTVQLVVNPKIDVKHFEKMLERVYGLISMYGIPALDAIGLNLHGYRNVREVLYYSIRLNQLTELILSAGVGRTISKKEYTAPVSFGQINRSRTISYLRHGLTLIVSNRIHTGFPDSALRILANFHAMLIDELEQIAGRFNSIEYLSPLTRFITNEIYKHKHYLYDTLLIDYLEASPSEIVSNKRLLERARTSIGINKWLRETLDLTEYYLANIPSRLILPKMHPTIAIQPIPTSKVYELWVLSLFDQSLRKRTRNIPRIKSAAGGLEMIYDGSEVYYNIPKLNWSKLFSQMISKAPRPDMILAGLGKRAIVDAKYREPGNLNVSDIERLISYLIDYSEPQDHEEIKGFLVTLGNKECLYQREDTTPKIRVYHVNADPAFEDNAISNIERVLGIVYSQKH